MMDRYSITSLEGSGDGLYAGGSWVHGSLATGGGRVISLDVLDAMLGVAGADVEFDGEPAEVFEAVDVGDEVALAGEKYDFSTGMEVWIEGSEALLLSFVGLMVEKESCCSVE